MQRHRRYLGEVNDSQRAAWTKPIEVFRSGGAADAGVGLVSGLATDSGTRGGLRSAGAPGRARTAPSPAMGGVLGGGSVGAAVGGEAFWRERLPLSREGTDWRHGLQTLVTHRLLEPGSEWRLHREG